MSASVRGADFGADLQGAIVTMLCNELNVRDIEEDQDGDLTFRYQGGMHQLIFDANDPHFLQLRYPAFYELVPSTKRDGVLEACARVNRNVKLVKMFPVVSSGGEEQIHAAVEICVHESTHISAGQMERFLDAIFFAVRKFHESLAQMNVGSAANAAQSPAGHVGGSASKPH